MAMDDRRAVPERSEGLRELARRRTRLALLSLLAVGLVSGGSLPVEVEAIPATALPQAGDHAWIFDRLADLNPHLSERSRHRIASAILRASRAHGLDPELVMAVLDVESNARPWARSPKGAVGLMQVMPYMIEPLTLAGSSLTFESNIEAGCLILSDNIRRLGEADGISAYFWGSRIRGVAYLRKVRSAREEIRRLRVS